MPKSARYPCAANWAFPLLVWLVYLQVPEVFVDASGMVNMPTVKNGQAFDGNAELRMAYATTTFGDDSAPNTFPHQLGRTLYFSMKSFPIFLPLLHLDEFLRNLVLYIIRWGIIVHEIVSFFFL